MSARPIWRGTLRLALVTCPVALVNVTQERQDLHFNLINPETGHRVRLLTVDAETGDELDRRELVKGYEFQKDHYVLLDDEDFERARIPSSSTMTIDKVVRAAAIDPLYFDHSYYVLPDGEAGTDVYVVLRDALAHTANAALSRLVLQRRERPAAITASGRGLVLHTLHEEGDLASPREAFAGLDAAMVKLAEQLLERQAGKFDPGDTEDRYEARLREVIDAKIRGQGFTPPEEEEPPSNVVDLMAALKASLGGRSGEKKEKKPARRAPQKALRKAARARRSA
jgi:DNA end-binding protein Ku